MRRHPLKLSQKLKKLKKLVEVWVQNLEMEKIQSLLGIQKAKVWVGKSYWKNNCDWILLNPIYVFDIHI